MLKHVQTSPHRAISTASLRKSQIGGSPKHLRQSSSPSVLSVSSGPYSSSSSSTSSTGSEASSWASSRTSLLRCSNTSSSCCKDGNTTAEARVEPTAHNEETLAKRRNTLIGSSSAICPNCLKRKKLPPSHLRRRSDSTFSCSNLNESQRCSSSKNGNNCTCTKEHLMKGLINNQGGATALQLPPLDRLTLLEEAENEGDE